MRPLLALACLTAVAGAALAKPAHLKSLVDALGPDITARVNDCRACHEPAEAGAAPDAPRPHNHFGERLVELRSTLKAAKKSFDIADRLDALNESDSDGDGVGDLSELLLGTLPGDAKDVPATAVRASAPAKLAAYRARRSAYRWRPFEPVVRPTPPAASGEWGRNPIDAFLSEVHAKYRLTPRPEADRLTLIRRVTLDLTGLPPTPREIDDFFADTRPDAYERMVDRLLGSTAFGERWGRHWLDVWRYSDWGGFGAEVRDSQPHVWRWRDWVVESLNADTPYDRMITLMLAADEAAPGDQSAARATGFLARNWYKFSREVWLDRAVEHTSKAFLGVTLNCARCHDHMYDPLPQTDYYAFRAVFQPHEVRAEPLDAGDGQLVRVYDAHVGVPTYLFNRGNDKEPDKSRVIAPAVPAVLGGSFAVTPVPLPAGSPDRRPGAIRERRAALAKAVADALAAPQPTRKALLEAVELARLRADEFERMLAWESDGRGAEELNAVQRRIALLDAEKAQREKDAPETRDAVAKARAALSAPPSTQVTPAALSQLPAESTGRRLALARWIADANHPLTARVAVNHVWLRHFGQPLVPSVFDFGKNGQPPAHPALADFLAAEFTAGKWSLKRLHRLIVTSRAYRGDSRPDPEMLKRDPDNRHYWRVAPRRLEAEAVRDAVLCVSGLLDRHAGGPELDEGSAETTFRRSLYYRHAPEKHAPFLSLFDAANEADCYRRTETVTPQQALALANAPLIDVAAARLAEELKDERDFATAAFKRVLGRLPRPDEASACAAFLAEPGTTGRAGLLRVLLNGHEFVTQR